jgi:hypothetical protein
VKDTVVRFIADDGADISLISEKAAHLFGLERKPADTIDVVGVGVAEANETVKLPHDLGVAYVHANLNILSENSLLESHTFERIGENGPHPHYLVAKHRDTGKSWTFKRSLEEYGNVLWNIDITRSMFKQVLASFYQPRTIGNREPSAEEATLISAAKYDHHRLGHPSDETFLWQIKNLPTITATERGLKLWREIDGKCTGCLADTPRHAKKPSSKPVICEPGEVIAGDIMFLDSTAKKSPALLLLDIGSECPFYEKISGRTLGDVKQAMQVTLGQWEKANHKPKELLFDREAAIIAAKSWAEATYKMELKPTAAGQKQPHAEVTIRTIKSKARRLRAGVKDRFGYEFPWLDKLYRHAVGLIQRTPKQGNDKCPLELFGGASVKIDYERDFRCEFGEPIYVERPKAGVYTGSEPRMELGIFVENPMNGTGVLHVYLLQTKKVVSRLKFERGEVPDWARRVLDKLVYEKIELEFLDDQGDVPPELQQVPSSVESNVAPAAAAELESDRSSATDTPEGSPIDTGESPGEEPRIAGDEDIASEEEPPHDAGSAPEEEPPDEAGSASGEELHVDAGGEEPSQEQAAAPSEHQHQYGLRPRARPDYRAMVSHYEAKSSPVQSPTLRVHGGDPDEIDDIASLNHVHQISFRQALKTDKADAARESMVKEIKQALQFKAFHGVHLKDLSAEEKGRILQSTSLYKEKFLPTGEFEKSKSRILVRGDMQKPEYTAATSSPVVRHETVMWFLAVCVVCKLHRLKIDFIGAYLNTPRPAEVKYKHVWIPADIAAILVELAPWFAEFVQEDGRILVEMDKLFYGYKEAALFWFLLLTSVLKKHGFQQSYWDPCLLFLYNDTYEINLVLTVDDVLAGATTKAGLAFLVDICEREFEGGITIQEGDVITHLGMVLDFATPGQVTLGQDKFVRDLLEQCDEWKKHTRFAATPMAATYHENELSAHQELLPDDKRIKFHSLVMSAMYMAKRTWPNILYAVNILSSVVRAPKVYHWNALMRVLAYVDRMKDVHRLVIKPTTLNVVCSADASHLCHSDMTGQTGGCVGVAGAGGVPDAYFIFVTLKHLLVTKNAMETEVVAQDTMAEFAVWSEGVRNDLIPPSIVRDMPITRAVLKGSDGSASKPVYDKFEAILMQCDNQAAILSLEHGRGSFKRSKHILKRYFWITELINAGRMVMKWLSGEVMPADMLTKPVTEEVHNRLLPLLVGVYILSSVAQHGSSKKV